MTYTEPLALLFLLIGAAGLYRLHRHNGGGGRQLVGLSIGGLLLVLWPPVDWLASRPLEIWYPHQALPQGAAEAIVVLGGSVDPPQPGRPFALPGRDTYQRCMYAAWLFRTWRNLPVLACGGIASSDSGEQPVSVVMRHVLQAEGVPAAMIWTEERSRNTHENALFGAEILRQHGINRIVLVVEGYFMPRAERSFRKQGIIVIPAVSQLRRLEMNRDDFLPSWKALAGNERTLHEAVGLAWYWIRGWV